ncbi:invasion associated locus B family protein [Pseudaestuariivita atlantica]|uniref:Invasion protein n=1 Tax=Pseudaestuariivita atlantica TaxID=1317121 RepID=A0A0L1JN20_9RHOB|nr:invasion associated locus B family protein [Pseudaestuariivita atlantica]KNG93151.1 hypothetical protein ATO11_13865 [Pseudaestuariivita atlantica]
MLERMTWLALVAGIALAGPALAQTTEGEGDAPAATNEVDGGLSTPLSTGEEVTEGPRIGSTYVVEEIGDWTLQCLKAPEGQEDPCQLYQLLRDASGNAVAEVSIFRIPPGGQVEAGATFVVPLETLLTSQLTVSVDGGKAKRYPYSFCNQIGCYARVGLLGADVTSFKRGAKATVTLVPFAAPDQKVELDMSLSGFTAGLAKASIIPPR